MKNKKIIIAAGIVILLIIGGIVTAVIINSNANSKKQQEVSVPTKQSADELKAKAVEAIKNKDNDTAKANLEAAKKQYEALGDTNNVVDTDAQLYFIEHPTTPPTTPGAQATPVTDTTK